MQGLGLHLLLIFALTLHAGLGQDVKARGLAITLLLAPLARTLSLALPLARLPQLLWLPAILAPLLAAAWLVGRELEFARTARVMSRPGVFAQGLLMCGGLGIGALQYLLLPPEALPQVLAWNTAALGGLMALVVLGIAEELIFRGLLQSAALLALGRWALVYVSLLFAAMHIGYRSSPALIFAFSVGLVLAVTVQLSGTVGGVALAHALANLTAAVFMPFLEREASPGLVFAGYSIIVAGSLIAGTVLVLLLIEELLRRRVVRRTPIPLPAMRASRLAMGLRYLDLAQRTGLPARLIAEIEHGLRPLEPEHGQIIGRVLGLAPQQFAAR